MKLVEQLQNLSPDEDSAVTVDQLNFTADIVGLGIAELASVSGDNTSLNAKACSNLAAQTIATY